MVSDALNVPFPRNRLPILGTSVLHGHMMHSWNLRNVVVVWRDGRDVLISLYFHSLFVNNKSSNIVLVNKFRKDLDFADYDDVKANLCQFMEYVFERKRFTRYSWSDFVNKWHGNFKYVHVRYEDMLRNAEDELARAINSLVISDVDKDQISSIVDRYSFENMSGRKAGDENARSFMRKGISGDWKNYFDREDRELFNQYAGKELELLDYEADARWVDQD